MKLLYLLPVAAAVTTHDRIASMQTTLRGIAATAKKEGKIDEDTKIAVRGFMSTMNDTLVNALVEETRCNQESINTALAALNNCYTVRENTFAGDVNTKAETRDASRNALTASKNCGTGCASGRGAALVQAKLPAGHNYSYDISGRHWNRTSRDDLATSDFDPTEGNPVHVSVLAKTTCDEGNQCQGEEDCWNKMKNKCDQLDNMVKNTISGSKAEPEFCDTAAFPQTTKPVAHPHTTNVVGRAYFPWEAQKIGSDPLYTWFTEMNQFTDDNFASYKECRSECHCFRNLHQHRVYDSHRKQAAFERDFCAWAHSIDVTCSTYKSCYDEKKGDLEALEAIVRGQEEQFKKQQQALECALCYGNELLKDQTDLSACDSETTCENCEPLCIDYPEVPDYVCCQGARTRPCDADWEAAEYSCWSDQTPPNECNGCGHTNIWVEECGDA